MGDNSCIMSRHFFDLSGGVYISNGTIIAGRSSEFWTHERFKGKSYLVPKPIVFGSEVYVGAHVLVAPGVRIPNNASIGLGCVVNKTTDIEGALIVGNPAIVKERNNIASSS
jgi:acetyltransferase-like isoleucine patch superfamily enzyme